MTIERGSTLDRYELLCHLAKGGMANVWLARMCSKPEFERLFAIKTVLPSEADSAEFRTMFLDEARLVSRIDHPNVVRVTDVGEHEGLPYLVMELIEGDSLDKLMADVGRAGASIPLGIVLRIVTDACHGLAAAHELSDAQGAPLNVVHRDVSPQNILVATTGIAKVIDFGIAKGRDRASAKTSAGMLKGKACYMPREQACGEEVDARTDTWALGAVLYYLLAGRAPYKSDSELATLKKAITAAPIPPLSPNFPQPVRALVEKALAHDPAMRFQSAADFASALESVAVKLGVAASSGDVKSFVRSAMASRLAARRELVSQALAEATTRESCRLAAAKPVEIDVDVDAGGDAGADAGGGTAFGAVRSAWRDAHPEPRRMRARLGLGALAATAVVVVGLAAAFGPARTRSAAGNGPPPVVAAIVARGDSVPLTAAATTATPATATADTPTVATPTPAALPVPPPHANAPSPRVAAALPASAPAAPPSAKATTKKSRDDEAGF
jgi:serine/threonine-protein kinase